MRYVVNGAVPRTMLEDMDISAECCPAEITRPFVLPARSHTLDRFLPGAQDS
jgi:hypothetical protein